MKPPILFLYGLDEDSQGFEVTSTLELVDGACAALRELGWVVEPRCITHSISAAIAPFKPAKWLVFNVCEGLPHQAFYYAKVALELGKRGYTFTGCDYFSLDHTQYKWMMKHLLEQQHVATPAWAVTEDPITLQFDAYPAIVKPASEHCSYGITRESVVMNIAEARLQAVRLIAQYHGPAMIESFCDSDEYNVSLWGDAHPEVLGISTMQYGYFADIHDRLCTFDAKWTPESEAYKCIPAICPAPVSPELKMALERVALAAYHASSLRDYGRVDIRLHNGQPMVLDINANCDISDGGGFFNAARAAGYSYGGMLEHIAHIAMDRMPMHAITDAELIYEQPPELVMAVR